jgi:hypothetical protein
MLSLPFQESKCMLLTYFVLLFLLFVILLVGGILGYVFRQQVKMFFFFNSSEIIQLDYWKNRTSQLLRYCTLWLGLSLMNSFYQLSTIFTFRLPVDYVLRWSARFAITILTNQICQSRWHGIRRKEMSVCFKKTLFADVTLKIAS